MPSIVPLSGGFKMAEEINSIRDAVIDAGGVLSATEMNFEAIRDAASFSKFHPDYLQGATNLNTITKFSQFRGYPFATNYNIVIMSFQAKANVYGESYPNGTEWRLKATFQKVGATVSNNVFADIRKVATSSNPLGWEMQIFGLSLIGANPNYWAGFETVGIHSNLYQPGSLTEVSGRVLFDVDNFWASYTDDFTVTLEIFRNNVKIDLEENVVGMQYIDGYDLDARSNIGVTGSTANLLYLKSPPAYVGASEGLRPSWASMNPNVFETFPYPF